MTRMNWTVLLIFLVLVWTAPATAQQPSFPVDTPNEFDQRTDPVSLIGAYYNAISRGDYGRAYGYWEQPPGNRTQEQFASGFADTLSARALVRLPVVVDAGAGNAYATIPTLVSALHLDGSVHYYAGCFTAHKVNVPIGNATAPDPNWYFREGRLREQPVPNLAVLENACQQSVSLTSNPFPFEQLDPVQVLQSYFSAFASGQVQQASAFWETPGDLFAPAYGALVASAQGMRVFVNPEVYSEGAAGSIYAVVPALMIIDGADAPFYVTACFTTRKSNVPQGIGETLDPNWSITDVTLNPATDEPSAITILATGCADPSSLAAG